VLIAELERSSTLAWPCLDQAFVGQWELRAAHGFTGRANTVMTAGNVGMPTELAIEACEIWYRQRSLPTGFKLSPATEPRNLVETLDERGYQNSRKGAQVMIGPVVTDSINSSGTREEFSPGWMEAYVAGSMMSDAQVPILKRLLGRIELPHTFGSFLADGIVASCGLGILESQTLWLFDIATRPVYRRQGFARDVLSRLLNWGAANGAWRAALQVQTDNSTAQALYRSIGFEPVYEYEYRYLAEPQ
jgi:GNAT superfamily N-acetyltransferase